MDTIFEINGSDAIPVRALPWLTAWAFGAYAVAEALAGDEYPWAAKIRAYRLLDGAIQNVSQHEWQNIILPRIHALYERYLDDVDFQRRATAELPAGVFVWREQWEQAYNNSPDGPAGVHPDVLLNPENYDDDDLLCSLDANDLILNYAPNLLPDCVGLVTEGFAHGKQVPQAAPVVAAVAATPAPVVAASDGPAKPKRRTWQDIAMPYIEDTFKSGQYTTAKELYRALEKKAGPDSPFNRGTGSNTDSLYVREISQNLTFKTVQNVVWPKLKTSR